GEQHAAPARRGECHSEIPLTVVAADPLSRAVLRPVGRLRRDQPSGTELRRCRWARTGRRGAATTLRLTTVRAGHQRHLGGLQTPAQRFKGKRYPFADRNRTGECLEHLPDRLEYSVSFRHLVEQLVSLNRARRITGVDGNQLKLVALWPTWGVAEP